MSHNGSSLVCQSTSFGVSCKQKIFTEEERAGCFTLIIFMLSCDSLCSTSLPHGAMGCSAVIVAFSGHTHFFLIEVGLYRFNLLAELYS